MFLRPTTNYILVFRCNSTEQFLKYKEILRKILNGNEMNIHKITRCLSKCDKDSFSSKPMGVMEAQPNTDPGLENTIRLLFYSASVEHERRVQVNNI